MNEFSLVDQHCGCCRTGPGAAGKRFFDSPLMDTHRDPALAGFDQRLCQHHELHIGTLVARMHLRCPVQLEGFQMPSGEFSAWTMALSQESPLDPTEAMASASWSLAVQRRTLSCTPRSESTPEFRLTQIGLGNGHMILPSLTAH